MNDVDQSDPVVEQSDPPSVTDEESRHNEADKVHWEREKAKLEAERLKSHWSRWGDRVVRIVSMVAAVGLAFIGIFAAQKLLEVREATLKYEKLLYEGDLQVLQKRLNDWSSTTALVLNEPSGLTHSNLWLPGRIPLVLAVDDEVKAIFILQGLKGSDSIVVARMLPLKGNVDDLEAICFDDRSEQFVAIASHRRTDREQVLRVVRFRIEPDEWDQPGYEPVITSVNKVGLLGVLMKAAELAIKKDGSKYTIRGRYRIPGQKDWEDGSQRRWDQKQNNAAQPYALEIEGAVCIESTLYLGLKLPIGAGGNHAFLVATPMEGVFAEPAKIERVHVESLSVGWNLGITALAFDADKKYLIAASNPPLKYYGDQYEVKQDEVYGRSRLSVFTKDGPNFKLKGWTLDYYHDNAKLEGLAVVDDELWLAFDGEEPHLERRKLVDVYAKLRE